MAVITGWKALLALPPAAFESLGPLIEAALREPENPQNKSMVELFCQRHSVDPAQAVAAIRSCDFLLRQSAAINLPADDFRLDLEFLSRGNPVGVDLLMGSYEAVRDNLRQAILIETLADHGKVLVGLEWRVDRVEVSHRGASLDTPVFFLNLQYRDGDETRKLSLQLTPEALRSLRGFCEQFSG